MLLPSEIGYAKVKKNPETGSSKNVWAEHVGALQKLSIVGKVLSKFDFEKKIRINATGQYKRECISDATYNISKILEARGFKTELNYMNNARTRGQIEAQLRSKKTNIFSKWRRKVIGKNKSRKIKKK